MPILHYLPPSAPCRAVLLLGKLLNIEFDLRFIDLMKGEHLKPEFIEVGHINYCFYCNDCTMIIFSNF